MIEITDLAREDATYIVKWNRGTDADFLQQWSGRGYHYPITEEAVKERIEQSKNANYRVFKIIKDRQVIGAIELMNIDQANQKATVGRFLLAPEYRGRGYGTESLKQFIRNIFEKTELQLLDLYVFKFNKGAIRCYEKVGFRMNQEIEHHKGRIVIQMKLLRQDFEENYKKKR